jgi:hypothetical protein
MLETKKLHYHSSFSDSFRGEPACLTLVLEVLLPHFAFFYCKISILAESHSAYHGGE